MDDEAAEAQKARVMALWDAWGKPLGLGYWQRIAHEWYRGAIPDYPEAAMVVTAQWQYKRAAIAVDLTQVADLDAEALTAVYVHELMHLFLSGLVDAHAARVDRGAFRMIEEHTATTLAQAVLWLRDVTAVESAPAPKKGRAR